MVIDEKETVSQIRNILVNEKWDEFTITGISFKHKALQILKKEFPPFDLILLEPQNPHISEKFHRVLLKETSTPVVLISSLEYPEDILTPLREGCEGYIKKPLKPERFINRLKEILSEIEVKNPGSKKSKSRKVFVR